MSQGGYGGGNPGGGWGPPPGGGGYGPPPGGGGYGPPPGAPPGGGGYGGPPPGAPPGGGGGGPQSPYQPPAGGGGGGFGGPPPGAGGEGVGRLMKTAAIGGVIGGILSAIPVLNWLNCCFCLLNLGGAAIGINMYLKEHEGENLSNGDAAISGAVSGAVAGLIAGIGGLVTSLVLGSLLVGLYKNLPSGAAGAMSQMGARGAFGIIIDPPLYAAFGALGGFLSMQLFFKDRLRS